MASYDSDLVRPKSQVTTSRGRMVLGAVAGAAAILGAVALVDHQARVTSLISRGNIVLPGAGPGDVQVSTATKQKQIMAAQARDETDSFHVFSPPLPALLTPLATRSDLKTVIKKQILSSAHESHDQVLEKRLEDAAAEKASVMVPWVHWPGHPHTGPSDKYKSPRKQSLLQDGLWGVDKAAQVMPLKELIQRQAVDHMLHSGHVADYQLAAADEKAHHGEGGQHDARANADCAPFC